MYEEEVFDWYDVGVPLVDAGVEYMVDVGVGEGVLGSEEPSSEVDAEIGTGAVSAGLDVYEEVDV